MLGFLHVRAMDAGFLGPPLAFYRGFLRPSGRKSNIERRRDFPIFDECWVSWVFWPKKPNIHRRRDFAESVIGGRWKFCGGRVRPVTPLQLDHSSNPLRRAS
jgi:hypothetical protein